MSCTCQLLRPANFEEKMEASSAPILSYLCSICQLWSSKNIMPIYCVPMFVEFVILGVAKTTDVLSVSNEAGELTELSKYTLSKIF